MKPDDTYYPLAPPNQDSFELGISMRNKLAHDFCMAHFSNFDSLQQYGKNNPPNSTYKQYQEATINSAFIYADEFIKKSQNKEQ